MRVLGIAALAAVTLTLAASAQTEPNIRWYKVVNDTTLDTTNATEDDPYPCAQNVSISTKCSGSVVENYQVLAQNSHRIFGCTSNHEGINVRKDHDLGSYTSDWQCLMSSAPQGMQSVTQVVTVTGQLTSCAGASISVTPSCDWSKYPR